MQQTAFCYRCGSNHPIEEMRQILTKSGKRLRCIISIEAAKVGKDVREAYGRLETESNKATSKFNKSFKQT